MLNGRGKEMKEYKIDLSMYEGKVRELVSEAIQKKAFGMGHPGWASGGKVIQFSRMTYLFFEESCLVFGNNKQNYERNSLPEISAADFLALTPEDVQDAPKEPEFKPFDRVLVRDYDNDAWIANIYSHRDENCTFIHQTFGGVGYHQCIPYEGNEHLLGTTEGVE